ncbi:MAG TPA: hypothetical protein VI749_04735 [Candidatus Omnitrophota bacterium]|nr:hypothetical protein [Candidatus Omnitrophota bacterium]
MTLSKKGAHSHLQAWIREEQELATTLSMKDRVFYLFLRTITAFDAPQQTGEGGLRLENFRDMFRRHYDKDPQLFEVGCYLLFVLRRWHEEHHITSAQSDLMEFVQYNYARLFNKFLSIPNTQEIIDNRMAIYGSLTPGNETVCDLYLVQLIRRSGPKGKPRVMDASILEPLVAAAKHPLSRQVDSFREHAVPPLMKGMENVYHGLGFLDT